MLLSLPHRSLALAERGSDLVPGSLDTCLSTPEVARTPLLMRRGHSSLESVLKTFRVEAQSLPSSLGTTLETVRTLGAWRENIELETKPPACDTRSSL